MPATDFLVYLGGGKARDGDLEAHAREHNLAVVNIDTKHGGYGHNLTRREVTQALVRLASHPRCRCVVVSIPCGTWSALRYVKPGPDVLRRLPHHAEGIPREDRTLPKKVTLANTMLDNAIEVVDAACEHGADAMFESPVSRDANSPHAINGREDHASMWSYPALGRLAARRGMSGVA